MSSALDQFLGDVEPAQAEVPEQPSVPDEAEAQQVQQEVADELPQEERQDGTPGRQVPLPALLEERRRRQESDEKLRQIEQKLKELEYRQHPQQMPVKDDLEITDDEFYSDLPGAARKLEQRTERKLREAMLQMSVEMAKTQLPDYVEVLNHYVSVVTENPAIDIAVKQSTNPAFEAYRLVKGHLESKKAITPDKIQDLVKAEAQKMLQEELSKRGLSQAAQIPPSLAAARGSGASRREEPDRELSLKEIMASRKRR